MLIGEDGRIAMCWKCSSSIMKRFHDDLIDCDRMELAGCKQNPDIKEYADTQKMCPILIELRNEE